MSVPVEVLAVMDTDGRAVALYADTCSDGSLRKQQWVSHLAKHDEARAAVAEQQAILRRLVAWNHNVNGDGAELAELLALAEARMGRGDVTGERRHGIERIPAVAELIEAAKQASATLGHAYHTTLTGKLAEYAHADYQRLDAALARVQGGAA
jgi:hypothetical protein